ncbi:hypothetical protein N2152v2_001944 [Parachlorella kessleri]
MVSPWEWYAHASDEYPLLMDCLNSLVLWTIGDFLAQLIEKKGFSLRRLLCTSCWGFFAIAPFGHYWYLGLEAFVSHIAAEGSVFCDLAVFGSIHVIGFFTFLTLVEGGSWQDVGHKFRTDFWSTYAAECAFWSIVQTFNFSLVPVKYQLLVVNTAALFDSTFLCWARSQADWSAGIRRWFARLLPGWGSAAGTAGEKCDVASADAKWQPLPSSGEYVDGHTEVEISPTWVSREPLLGRSDSTPDTEG